MKCPKCGTENAVTRLYCDHCGFELEHDLTQVKASVDQEIRVERMRSIARSIRWCFVVAFILFVAGYTFRRTYRDLPTNEIVAFASAPNVQIDDRVSVDTQEFGVELTKPPSDSRAPDPAFGEKAVEAELVKEACQRIAVSVRQRGMGRAIEGILSGDVVFYVPAQPQPKPIHIADVFRIVPVGDGRWEIHARGLAAPVRIAIPDAAKVKLIVLQGYDTPKPTHTTIPLDALEELKPAF